MSQQFTAPHVGVNGRGRIDGVRGTQTGAVNCPGEGRTGPLRA